MFQQNYSFRINYTQIYLHTRDLMLSNYLKKYYFIFNYYLLLFIFNIYA